MKLLFMVVIGIYLSGFYGKKWVEIYCIGENKDMVKVMFCDVVVMICVFILNKDGLMLEDEVFVICGMGDFVYKIEYVVFGFLM